MSSSGQNRSVGAFRSKLLQAGGCRKKLSSIAVIRIRNSSKDELEAVRLVWLELVCIFILRGSGSFSHMISSDIGVRTSVSPAGDGKPRTARRVSGVRP